MTGAPLTGGFWVRLADDSGYGTEVDSLAALAGLKPVADPQITRDLNNGASLKERVDEVQKAALVSEALSEARVNLAVEKALTERARLSPPTQREIVKASAAAIQEEEPGLSRASAAVKAFDRWPELDAIYAAAPVDAADVIGRRPVAKSGYQANAKVAGRFAAQQSWDAIEEKATQLQTADPSLSKAAAIIKVGEDNPQLLQAYHQANGWAH